MKRYSSSQLTFRGDEEQYVKQRESSLSPKSRKRCDQIIAFIPNPGKVVYILMFLLLFDIFVRFEGRKPSWFNVQESVQSIQDLASMDSNEVHLHLQGDIQVHANVDSQIEKGFKRSNNHQRCDLRVWTRQSRQPWANKFYANRDYFEPCTFTPIEEGGPIPTIFLVNGRSGSDVTWSTITTLAGKATPIGEHTGENKVKAMEFLGSMTAEEGAWWITEHLCEFTRRHCDAPVAGFKWKPFVDSWSLPSSQAMLEKIATFDSPKIRVIFMTRNPLDVMISKVKHKRYDMKAHCKPEDEKCLKKAQKKNKGLRLSTDTLVQDISDAFAAFDVFESRLKELGIMHIKVTYEELYEKDHAEEWMRIFRFLGRGPGKDLTIDQVRQTFKYATTFAKFHNESLSNYDEVFNVLSGTEYESLLH